MMMTSFSSSSTTIFSSASFKSEFAPDDLLAAETATTISDALLLKFEEVIKKVRHGPASLVVARLVVRQWSQVSTPDASDAQIGVINNGVSLNLTSVSSASMRSQEDQEVEGNRTIASPTGRVLMDCALTFADMPIVLSGSGVSARLFVKSRD
nr:hypothetical protein Iba_chr04dCG15550 [Ipomoea batatas]